MSRVVQNSQDAMNSLKASLRQTSMAAASHAWKTTFANSKASATGTTNCPGTTDISHSPIPPFRYEPLDSSNNSIRLIAILPGREDDLLHCILYPNVPRTAYTCLSYEWREERPLKRILVNDGFLMVRSNLYNFLLNARRCKYEEPLWIDAICIDQFNTTEKNHQVRLMGDIYGEAATVIVWLGLSNEENEAIQTFKMLLDGQGYSRICRTLQRVWWYYRESATTLRMGSGAPIQTLISFFDHANVALLITLTSFTSDERTYDEVINFASALTRAVDNVMASAYWNRAWILQELILAQKVKVLFADSIIGLQCVLDIVERRTKEQLGQASTPDQDEQLRLPTWSPPWAQIDDILRTKSNSRSYSRRLGLGQALNLSTERECHDPRDRIYSVLSFVRNGKKFNIDYGSTKEQVLWRIARFEVSLYNQDPGVLKEPTFEEMCVQVLSPIVPAFAALRLLPPTSGWLVNVRRLVEFVGKFEQLEQRMYWLSPPPDIEVVYGRREVASFCLPLILKDPVCSREEKTIVEFVVYRNDDILPAHPWRIRRQLRLWQQSGRGSWRVSHTFRGGELALSSWN